MALTSKLEADFSDFVTETKKANAAMDTMQGEADQTAAAFDRSSVVVGKFGDAAGKAGPQISGLQRGLSVTETALTTLGVAGAGQISNLGALATSAAKLAGTLGTLGTAAAVVASGFGGWKVGRMIAEANNLDPIMAELGARILNLGSVSKETAAAQQWLIDRAKAFGYAGNDAAQAAKVVADAVKQQQLSFTTGAKLVDEYNKQLKNAASDGLPGLRRELEAGVMTQDDLRLKYKVSAEAIKHLEGELRKEASARRETDEAAKQQADAMREVSEAITGQSAVLDTLSDAEREAAETALASGVAQGTVAKAYGLTAVQVKAVADSIKETETAVKNLTAAEKIVSDANQTWNEQIVERSATTTEKLIADVEAWRAAQTASLDALEGEHAEAYEKIEAIAAEKLLNIKVNWDTLKDGAIATYADQAARAEATYQQMLQHSTTYTTEAIANARRLAEETKIKFEEMSGAQSAMYVEFAKRDRAYSEALKGFNDDAANAAQKKWDQEQANMDRAIAYSQAYGVTIDEAKQKLGLMGDAGDNAGKKTAAAVDQASGSVQRLGTVVTQTAAEMQALAAHYQRIADDTRLQGGGGIGWSPWQVADNYADSARKLRERAGRQASWEAQQSGQSWGTRGPTSTTNTLNVNVNNADAQGIATKLMTEMRHAGIQLG